MNALRTLVSPRGAVFLLLAVLLVVCTILNPCLLYTSRCV